MGSNSYGAFQYLKMTGLASTFNSQFPVPTVYSTVYSVHFFRIVKKSLVLVERQNKSHKYHRPSIVRTVPCTVYSVQFTVYSVQCTVYSVQCTV